MYYLHSDNTENLIKSFETFDVLDIKMSILAHLEDNPTDTIEYSKDLSPEDAKKYVGKDIIDFYANNPKAGAPCKLILKGEKVFYKKLISETGLDS